MLPIHQSYEIQSAISEYLKATYTFQQQELNEVFDTFINDKTTGLYKGPFISLKLPFRKADANTEIPLEIKPNFTPYNHQLQAFLNLSTQEGNIPKPTLLTTGTGSGKTEAFLFPVLDYCYKNFGKKGVKVIILYPMNALASDQAKRLAQTIFNNPRLQNKITAGLFIGEGDAKKVGDSKKILPETMGKENIIEKKSAILDNPPDILLTNFKMLDYALMRNNYHKIWNGNLKDNQLLKFLVLDELHTYDGAQGSDVANLIRRLKLKLNIPENYLCPVGTSATISSSADSQKDLIEFASKIFEEQFSEESIIEESRLTVDEFLEKTTVNDYFPKTLEKIKQSLISIEDTPETYLKKQLTLWNFNENSNAEQIGNQLKELQIFRDILTISQSGILDLSEFLSELKRKNQNFDALPEKNEIYRLDAGFEILTSIFTLISNAKIVDNKRNTPFLYFQVQLWIKAIHGISRVVQETPAFVWNRDLPKDLKNSILPPYFCRECGASGWIGFKKENSEYFESDLKIVYDRFFAHNKNIWFFDLYREDLRADDYEPTDCDDDYLNTETLRLSDKKDKNSIHILRYRKTKGNFFENVCPHCNTRNTIAIVGTGIATMISVASGQILATNLDTTQDKNRKILIFSNGVQDAAHLAGFIEARNYRFMFRTALQGIINQNDEAITLPELYNQFIDYWKKHSDPNNEFPIDAYLYKFFPTDYLGKLKIDVFGSKNIYRKNFVEEFDLRMFWEIWSEFGYNATIGRTLEKTGVSSAFIEPEKISAVFHQMKFWLKDNQLGNIDEVSFLKFVFGFLYRLRTRGGIDHAFLKKFRTEKSNSFLITHGANKHHTFIRNFGERTRLPKFITDDASGFSKIFDLTTAKEGNKTNWYHKYFRKSFVMSVSENPLVNEFYDKFLEYLESEKILDKKIAAGIINYGINPQALKIVNNATQLKCEKCGHLITFSQNTGNIAIDMPCLQYNCGGKYKIFENKEFDYYRSVYSRAKSMRIYSNDHTGLLERRVREAIEINFKTRPKFNSTNILVATSTLEMGVDVGDLNITINSNIPPTPANFLQRIGRAGRATGTALILNFSGRDNHDRYFFAEPKEMMQGEINTPGCFLEAKEILKRHFTAFCIDSWTSSNPEQNSIPALIRFLNIIFIKETDTEFVLNKIIQFIKENEIELITKFKEKYVKFIDTSEGVLHLEHELRNGEIYNRLKSVYQLLHNEISYYFDKKKQILERSDSLPKTDPELLDLKKDLTNINGAIANYQKRNFIEYLTNIGILPNYAFPETGVSLNAQIRERTGDIENAAFQTKSLELIRPAKSALKELAPDNVFYTQGYKLKITGTRIINRKDEVLEHRFCSNCDHIELNINTKKENCPKCGHQSWRDLKNVHNFVKMSAMISYNDSQDSKIVDASEDRELKNYNISKHYKIDKKSSQGAHVLKKIPFGIEYLKSISEIEVNTGFIDGFFDRSRTVSINEKEHSGMGYVVCQACGKTSVKMLREEDDVKQYHYLFCKNRNQAYNGHSDQYFDEIYLFREMKTEAIKILLPTQEIDSETKIRLFKAGLSLGLKKYYKGNPQHLEISEYIEINKQTSKKDRYLLFVETIPGGTGYLSKLFDKEEFTKLLHYSYQAIKGCNCQFEEKDGCYHCIYTYSNQNDREILSRKEAEEIFKRIIDKTDEWVYVPEGLNKITDSGNIEESELEERFIKVLQTYISNSASKELDYSIETKKDNGVNNYILKFVNGNETVYYKIIPQKVLDSRDKIEFNTIPDFFIQCEDYQIDKISERDKLEQIKPIAVYLDGYHYHATAENNRFESDFKKRNALQKSGLFHNWTLTWDDLTRFEKTESDNLASWINPKIKDFLRKVKHQKVSSDWLEMYSSKNSFERLLTFLKYPLHQSITDNLQVLFFCLQNNILDKTIDKQQIEPLLIKPNLNLSAFQFEKGKQENYYYLDKIESNENIDYYVFQLPKDLSLKGKINVKPLKSDENWNKTNWENFWALYNLLQFSDTIDYEFVTLSNEISVQSISGNQNQEIFDNFDPKYHQLIDLLLQKEIDFNKTTTFVIEKNGENIAEADLGIESKKIVVGAFKSCQHIFEKQGYTIETIESLQNSLQNPYSGR